MMNFIKFILFLLVSMVLIGSIMALFDGKLLGGLIAALIIGGFYLYNHLERKSLATTIEAIDLEKRKLVIYLRSFGQEEVDNSFLARLRESIFGVFIPGVSNPIRDQEQQNLAKYLNQIGVYVAIGRPGEPIPFPGAKKVYVSDDDWQSVVNRWLRKSAAVVLEPGTTGEGMSWEIRQVINNVSPLSVLVILPRVKKDYGNVRHYLNQYLPKPLPEKVKGDIRLMTFKLDWEPFPINSLYPFYKQNGFDEPKDVDPYF